MSGLDAMDKGRHRIHQGSLPSQGCLCQSSKGKVINSISVSRGGRLSACAAAQDLRIPVHIKPV
ncbi:hypothetical protein CERZMDRAFT_90073 [Cercospora zeae-maydis SCOH1-5]|uniref:Uncharacterized protein n=1 Tax=Cercospora zeae-maydis SCOH1-5 TaxID=717836 RepID=A0A6A6FNV6_9PEZI|nr:hypothetical protein CERZMDRAFT_90073 [Cercospora zeae-maydis SCOH1-5]